MFRGMEKDAPHASWVTATASKKDDEEASVTSGYSQKSGESKTDGEDGEKAIVDEKFNVIIPCQPMHLSCN